MSEPEPNSPSTPNLRPAPIRDRVAPGKAGPALICLFVLALYGLITAVSVAEWERPPAEYSNNLLVRAFRAGHLYLPKDVPPGLAALPDPYDPAANLVYRMSPYSLHDLSYYRGRFYLYFGPTPALLLFWPWLLLTGHYLIHKWAVALFCAGTFLVSVALLRSIQRLTADTSAFPLLAGMLAVGLANGVPVLLQRADVCEVPIACASFLAFLALFFIWKALGAQSGATPAAPVALASLCYGLALGARPSLLFGSIILLVPLLNAAPRVSAGPPPRSSLVSALFSALLPLSLCLAALLLYNHARFGNPLEFGEHYQLAADRQDTAAHFSLRYLWFNFRVYGLAPVKLSPAFPFVRQIVSPPLPPGHATIEDPFGVLPNIPIVLLALFAPLAWRGLPDSDAARLRRFTVAVVLFFAATALTLGLFYGNCSRYEVEFLPALLLLSALGILGLDRNLARRPRRRLAARFACGLLLAVSVAFNLLLSTEHYAVERYNLGNFLTQIGRDADAIVQFRRAIAVRPDFTEAYDNLGNTLLQTGQAAAAVPQFQQALRLKPDSVEAHNNLGNAWLQLGRTADAASEYEAALRLDPTSPAMHYNLGNLYAESGRYADAAVQYEQTLRLRPAFAEAHFNLSAVLYQLGRRDEAAAHRVEALRLNPALGNAGR